MTYPTLPVLRTPDGIVKSLDQWREFAKRDDCLDRMVPGDLRAILRVKAEMLEALKMANECAAYCRKNHPDMQAGQGVPVEIFFNRAIAAAEGITSEDAS